MSSNPKAIPLASRRAEPGTPIPLDYGTTPGGTIYSSTPGGTRIIYDRNTLLSLRNSPLSRTPPAKLAYVAGVTGASLPHQAGSLHNRSHLNVETHDSESDDDEDSDDEKRKAIARAQEEEEAKAHDVLQNNKDGTQFDMDME
ncbi:Eukaryotic translation initiation factor 4E-binding protein 2 [Mortierella sp. AD010]|nr:Eukaryotic translation initiation factor 4E-binding protein 2 [Mortierella sp. AD010]KAF9992166.1 Eukaryotic translation initiation factor 4E-binding protein 2 [Entomortierella chlamydospora]